MLADLTTGWDAVLLGYGPLGVFAAVVLWFAIRYGTRVFEGHLSFMETTKQTQVRMADAIETLTEGGSGHIKTHRALGHFAEAQKKTTDNVEAHRHFDRAIDELRG